MKKYIKIQKHKIILFLLALLLSAGCILLILEVRPIHIYTIYKIAPGQPKEKISTSKSLDSAQKIMKKNAVPSEKINTFVENDRGQRVSITYGIVNIKHPANSDATVSYYFNYKDRMQDVAPAYSSDGYFSNTAMINGVAEVTFQQSAAVGQIPFEDVEILNIFDKEEVPSLSYYEVESDILYHHIAANPSSSEESLTIPLGPTNSHLSSGTYYSWDGHNFYKDFVLLVKEKEMNKAAYPAAHNKNYTTYNIPFIYTALFQKTQYTAADLDTYISTFLGPESSFSGTAELFFKGQEEYGLNAIALFSIICEKYDNGMGRDTIGKAEILKEAKLLTEDYLNKKSSHYAGDFLGNKAIGLNAYYSDDPYWGEKVASIYSQVDETLGKKDTSLKLSKEREQ